LLERCGIWWWTAEFVSGAAAIFADCALGLEVEVKWIVQVYRHCATLKQKKLSDLCSCKT
jgi:hypothetical protein